MVSVTNTYSFRNAVSESKCTDSLVLIIILRLSKNMSLFLAILTEIFRAKGAYVWNFLSNGLGIITILVCTYTYIDRKNDKADMVIC